MSESLTGESTATPASNEPTGQVPVDNTADVNSQEAISGEQSQETVSTDNTAEQPKQTKENGGADETDDGLAKFAKSQGIDLATATDNEKRLLKIARDNQKAARNPGNEKKITDAADELNAPAANEDEQFKLDFRQYKYERETDKFFGQDGIDRSLEPKMVEIIAQKAEQFGKDYAFNLSRDLPTLYNLARLESGVGDTTAAVEQGRREERDSIRKGQVASAGQAHATMQGESTPKITREWLDTKYDPSDPAQRKAVDEALARGDLY